MAVITIMMFMVDILKVNQNRLLQEKAIKAVNLAMGGIYERGFSHLHEQTGRKALKVPLLQPATIREKDTIYRLPVG